MEIQFKDNSVKVKAAFSEAARAFLEEASGELESQVKRNTRVDTGQTRRSWDHAVDREAQEAVVGNPLENAIWEEFGTGEYAVHGDGRKGGWAYRDERTGEWYFTKGKKPNRALQSAFNSLKTALIRRAQDIFREEMG